MWASGLRTVYYTHVTKDQPDQINEKYGPQAAKFDLSSTSVQITNKYSERESIDAVVSTIYIV